MAVTITDNRTIINEADANTGWTTTATLTAANTSPVPIESTNRLGMQVSTSTQNAYVAITSANMSSDGFLIYFWISHRAEFDTTANGGIQIQIGDSAATVNRVGYHVGGSDAGSFRHETGPVQWESYVLDTGNLGAFSTTTLAGSAVNLVLTAITKVGVVFKTLAKSVGGVDNCFIDISRFLDPSQNNGAAITITGGTSGDPGTFAEIAAADKLIGNQQAHGVVRQLGAGLYGVQGPLRFGNPTGTSSSWFEDQNVTIAFEDRFMTVNKYKIVIVDNGTGTTTFRLGVKVGSGSTATGADGCTIIVPSGVGGQFDAATDTDVTDVFIYGSTFDGFTQGISFRSGHEFIGGRILSSGQITAGGATMVNSQVSGSTATSALLWNVNTDTSGLLDGMSYTIGTSGHGIEFGSNTPSSITFNGITFTGYGGTPGSNLTSSSGSTDAAVYNNSGKEITINITGSGTTPSVRNGAGATTIVVSSVPLAVTVIDTATNPIQTAQVAIYLTSNDSELLNDDTDVNGEVSGSYSGGTPAAIYIRVRKSSTGDTKYIPASTTGSITSSGFSITITLREDPNA
jgi:hypothetical protein